MPPKRPPSQAPAKSAKKVKFGRAEETRRSVPSTGEDLFGADNEFAEEVDRHLEKCELLESCRRTD